MEFEIDLFKVGYFIGRYSTRAFVYFSSARMAVKGYSGITKIAHQHKIDSSNAQTVTDNLFECLQYIDI